MIWEPDPLEEPCAACNAEAGEECRQGCLGALTEYDRFWAETRNRVEDIWARHQGRAL